MEAHDDNCRIEEEQYDIETRILDFERKKGDPLRRQKICRSFSVVVTELIG